MDTILQSVLYSDQPDAVKKELLRRIVDSDNGGLDGRSCRGLLENAVRWSLNEHVAVDRVFGVVVLIHAGKYYSEVLVELVSDALPDICFSAHPSAAILDTISCLANAVPVQVRISHQSTVQQAVCKWISCDDGYQFTFSLLTKMAAFLTRVPLFIPSPSVMPASGLSRSVLACLANATWDKPEPGMDMTSVLVGDFKTISSLLHRIWSRDGSLTMLSLNIILRTISGAGGSLIASSPDGEKPQLSCCLAMALCAIPSSQVTSACKHGVLECGLDEKALKASLSVLFDWLLTVPLASMSRWVAEFMENMLCRKSYASTVFVLLPRLTRLFKVLHQPWARMEVLPIIAHILLGVHHAPVAYKLVLPQASALLHQLEEESSPEALSCLETLARVFRCLIFQFSDVPVEESLLSIVNKHDQGSIGDLTNELQRRTWRALVTSKRNHEQDGSKQKATRPAQGSTPKISIQVQDVQSLAAARTFAGGAKSPSVLAACGRAGLANLGNTCYVNSVLQALYMNSGFRHSVFKAADDSNSQSSLTALQRVMAYLMLTKRQDFAPRHFLSVARPLHFLPGTQQDCAEFCRHLLDVVHTQLSSLESESPDSASDDLTASPGSAGPGSRQGKPQLATCVERHYQLKLHTTYTCQACNHQSSQVEAAFDLMLAFGTSDSSVEGGRSSPCGPAVSHGVSPRASPTMGTGLCTPPNSPLTVAEPSSEEPITSHSDPTERLQPVCGPALQSPSDFVPADGVLDAKLRPEPSLPSTQFNTGIRGGDRSMMPVIAGEPTIGVPSVAVATAAPASSVSARKLSETKSRDAVKQPEELTQLLRTFLSAEALDGENAYDCAVCRGCQRGLRQVAIAHAPPQLFVTLMRFHFDRKTLQRSKIMVKVNYPRFLDLPCRSSAPNGIVPNASTRPCASTAPLSTDQSADSDRHHSAPGFIQEEAMRDGGDLDCNQVSSAQPPPSPSSSGCRRGSEGLARYELCAVIVHAGSSTEHGHYYTYACEPDAGLEDEPHLAAASGSPTLLPGSGADGGCVSSSSSQSMDINVSSTGPEGVASSDSVSVPARSHSDVLVDVQRTWYRFNDSCVRLSSLEEALSVGASSSDTAYMLMYNQVATSQDSLSPDIAGNAQTSCDDTAATASAPTNSASPFPAAGSRSSGVLDNPMLRSLTRAYQCQADIPALLAAEVTSDNLQLEKELSQLVLGLPVFGPQPKKPLPPPPPPPPGPGCGDGFSSSANRMVF